MKENIIEFEKPSDKRNWDTIIFVALFHILALVSLTMLNWASVAAALITWWISGSWGIGVGYHRLLTHRGFVTSKWLTRVLATCGALALQSGPISWVTTHRLHHAFTDTDRDPHSPRKGAYWAHMGWIFRGTGQAHPKAVEEKYSPDLLRDPYLVWIEKYFYLPTVVVSVAAYFIGGIPMVLAAVFLRTVIGWHCTWMVNSVTHIFGSRRFETDEDSRNNALVAALTFGEGWHNNHHAHPRSAKHGLVAREIDVNWIQIRLLEKLGLVSDVYALDLNTEKARRTMKKAA